jgi:hypothetical protein
MAKITIEIDMEDTQESWNALYRRIEEFDESAEKSAVKKPSLIQGANHVTYDLLLDPERAYGDVGDFFAVLTAQD